MSNEQKFAVVPHSNPSTRPLRASYAPAGFLQFVNAAKRKLDRTVQNHLPSNPPEKTIPPAMPG